MEVNIGEKPSEEGYRDAIHVPAVSVRVPLSAQPGEFVVLMDGVATLTKSADDAHGVIDPFLVEEPLPEPGKIPFRPSHKLVWVLLKPGQVERLRHEWDHDALPRVQEDSGYDDEEDYCRGCW